MDLGCVYLITNLINNKMYVGQHKNPNPDLRWKTHINNSKREGPKYALHGAMEKFGFKNFTIDVLHRCVRSKLNFYEEYFADLLHTYVWDESPGYNMARCGGQSRLRVPVSDETRRLLSISHIGKKRSPQSLLKLAESLRRAHAEMPEVWQIAADKTRAKLKGVSNANWGSHTEEANAKISKKLKGTKHTDEHARKVSESKKAGETGVKYITKNDTGYYVRVHNREYGDFERNYPTLDEAKIHLRDFIESGSKDKRKTQSGERFIKPHKWSGWIVYINNKTYGKFSKTFPTLEEAIVARDVFISKSKP